jgi:hypothetical protein
MCVFGTHWCTRDQKSNNMIIFVLVYMFTLIGMQRGRRGDLD